MKNLLEVLREQRTTFIRDSNNVKIITDLILYNALEKESFEIQKAIGRKNKKDLKNSLI